MMNAQINIVSEIFDEAGIIDPMEKYLLYLHAQIACYAFTSLQEDRNFSGYESAWNSPPALALREYLPKDQVDSKWVAALAEQTAKSDSLDPLKTILPDLVLGEIDALFIPIMNAPLKEKFYFLLKLWAVIQVGEELSYRPYSIGSGSFTVDTLSDRIYQNYLQWREQYPRYQKILQFEERDFFQIWLMAYGTPFRPEQVKLKRNLVKLLKELKAEGCPDDVILQYYFIARTAKDFRNIKSVTSYVDYFRKVFERSKQLLPGEEPPASPGEWFFFDSDRFDQCIKDWRNISALDFLRGFYYFGQKDPSKVIEAENSVPYQRMMSIISPADRVFVVGANPDFISRCQQDDGLAWKVFFLLPSRTLSQVYKQAYGNGHFGFLAQDENGSYQIVQSVIDTSHHGRELRFVDEVCVANFDIALLFAREATQNELHRILEWLPEILRQDAKLLFWTPQSLFEQEQYHIKQTIEKHWRCSEIDILPHSREAVWRRKHLLLTLSPGHSETPVEIYRSFLIQTRPEAGAVIQEPWPVKVPVFDLLQGSKTVNRLWEQYRGKTEKGPRRDTKCYHFSREVQLWYSWSNGRGTYAFYGVPTPKQEKMNPLSRGKRLSKKFEYRAKSEKEAETKMEKRLLNDPQLQSVIISEIERAYRSRSVTLKTFWYCNRDKLEQNSGYQREVMEELVRSASFSDLRSDAEITLADYQERMTAAFGERSQAERLRLWRQLNLLIGFAARSKRFSPNPLGEYLQTLLERDAGYQQARKSLAKRSYTLEEARLMQACLKAHLPMNGTFVGCAISFYTGMGNSEICALTWGDYRSIPEGDGKQLLVYKFLHPGGEVRKLGTEQRSAFRRVPVTAALGELLEQRLAFVKARLEERGVTCTTTELEKRPIVTMDADDFSDFRATASLRKAKEEMESAAGIESVDGSVLGIDQAEKTTNFNDYQADRFRSNFRYRALQTCLMSEAELCYLLGLSMPTTFSKHYCDYTNDFSQLILGRKLERWTSLHDQTPIREALENPLKDGTQTIRKQAARYNQRLCVELDITISPTESDKDSTLFVEVEDDCGVDMELHIAAVRGEKDGFDG